MSSPASSSPSPADPSRADPSRADPSRADPSRADPSRADPSRADPSRANPAAAAGVDPVAVAVVGASGYTGAELIRLLHGHKRVRLAGLYARGKAGQRLAQVFPQFAGIAELDERVLEPYDEAAVLAAANVVFTALPHGESAKVVAGLVARGVTVLDLSADFRLRDPAAYASWYGTAEHPEHPAPDLLARAVYGLPERHRAAIVGARLIAVPGCYPTASILPIAPLLAAGLVAPDGLVVDAKSGVSGAGRTPALSTHFPEAGEGIRPYKVAGTHRHTVEIEQELGLAAGRALTVTFSPHLVPMSRGIVSCIYATPTDPRRASAAYHDALLKAYAGEPFVTVLPPGQLPDSSFVRGSNRIHVAVCVDARAGRVLAIGAIDNLVKGASGQAVQCLNLALGFAEGEGLAGPGVFP
jgi:N-acetyl-gamma-glutamyl-phosphate reductase